MTDTLSTKWEFDISEVDKAIEKVNTLLAANEKSIKASTIAFTGLA